MPRLPKQPRPTNRHGIRSACAAELAAADRRRSLGDHAGARRHLERAHVLSQPLAGYHVRVHLAMLRLAVRRGDRHEVTGQLVRFVLAGPGSIVGRYPLGNTGGADVSAVAPMEIPHDLRAVLGAG